MSSDADMDPEHSASPKPNNLPCMFTVETFQEPDSEPSYIVRPTAIWNSLQPFKKFQLQEEHEIYHLHDTITVSRHDLPNSPLWTATVLEIRGHPKSMQAFLRLYWLYHPTQLPPSLRHPYHGRSELLASNSMAIISATAVTGRAHVHHWREEREPVPPSTGLFWRQTYDVRKQSLSPLHTPCPPPCIQHHNPDIPLIRCPRCTARMHKSCLQDARRPPQLQPANAASQSDSEPEPEPEAEASSSPPPKSKKRKSKNRKRDDSAAAAAISTTPPPLVKNKNKKSEQEKGDGHYWLKDKYCLGCGGSFRGW